jgi:hypothetical protein
MSVHGRARNCKVKTKQKTIINKKKLVGSRKQKVQMMNIEI